MNMQLRKWFKNVTMALACVATLTLTIAPMNVLAAGETASKVVFSTTNGKEITLTDEDVTALTEGANQATFAGSDNTVSKTAFVYGENAVQSVDWDKSTVSKDSVTSASLYLVFANRDESGVLEVLDSTYENGVFVEESEVFADFAGYMFGDGNCWNFFFESETEGMLAYEETFSFPVPKNAQELYEGQCTGYEDVKNYVFAVRYSYTSGDETVNEWAFFIPENSYLASAYAEDETDTTYEAMSVS